MKSCVVVGASSPAPQGPEVGTLSSNAANKRAGSPGEPCRRRHGFCSLGTQSRVQGPCLQDPLHKIFPRRRISPEPSTYPCLQLIACNCSLDPGRKSQCQEGDPMATPAGVRKTTKARSTLLACDNCRTKRVSHSLRVSF
jgi:hypothetical protein